MEKYFKMPAGFNGGAEWFGNAMRDDMTASDVLIDAAVHAINSHDELVAMNEELLVAASALVNLIMHPSLEADESLPELVAMQAAIAKAKASS